MFQGYIFITRISDVAISAALLKLREMKLHLFGLTNLQVFSKPNFLTSKMQLNSFLQELFSRVLVFGPLLGQTSLNPASLATQNITSPPSGKTVASYWNVHVFRCSYMVKHRIN